MPPETADSARLLTVYRRWSDTSTDLTKFKLENVELPQLYVIVALLLGILFSPIDDDFRASRNPLFGFTFDLPLSGVPLAVTVLFTALVSALATHRLLSRKTFQERSFRPAVLAVRFLLGGLPIFGFLTFPFWQWIVKHRPSWSLRDYPPQPRLVLAPQGMMAGGGSWRASLSDWLNSKWVLVPVVMNHTLATIAISRWYTRLDSSHPASLWVLIGSSLTLHLIAFSSIVSYLRYEIAQGWMSRRAGRSCSLRFPWDGCFPFHTYPFWPSCCSGFSLPRPRRTLRSYTKYFADVQPPNAFPSGWDWKRNCGRVGSVFPRRNVGAGLRDAVTRQPNPGSSRETS